MIQRFDARRLSLIIIAALAAGLGSGCKKTPPAPAPVQEPPAVTRSEPAETVNETPLRPIVEERPAPAPSMGAAAYNAQGLLKSVYFDFDRYEIRPDQRATLEANAGQLKGQLSRFNILIEGHCDERGTNEYNMALGDRRSNAARQFLIDLGIPAGRIRTISYGEERPADPGHNEESWARNRRAEFILEEG